MLRCSRAAHLRQPPALSPAAHQPCARAPASPCCTSSPLRLSPLPSARARALSLYFRIAASASAATFAAFVWS
eukprot:3849944-Pleurochrysis_carterae.AAC.1